jgi:hypothetical protein
MIKTLEMDFMFEDSKGTTALRNVRLVKIG